MNLISVTRLIVGIFLLTLVSGPAFGETLWKIGETDGTHAEFAMYGKYQPYPDLFPNDVNFEIGESNPAKDWCGLQPGPIDAWGGSKKHPFTVTFELPKVKKGVYLLRIRLAANHPDIPGSLDISVNGEPTSVQLPHAGHIDAWGNPSLGKPFAIDLPIARAAFKRGRNSVSFTGNGSWVVWDSVALARVDEGDLPWVDAESIRVEVKPFFVDCDGTLKQPARISMTLLRPLEKGELVLRHSGGTQSIPVENANFGAVDIQTEIPEVTEPGMLEFELRKDGETLASNRIDVKPARKWTIYVVPQAHVDVGYTDLQERAMEVHRKSNDDGLELSERYPEFVWSVESSYVMQDWIKTRSEAAVKHFFELSRKDRLGIEAFYGNVLTGLLSDEEAFRSLYYAKELSREYGSPFKSATLTDAPSHIWSVPTVLSKSGVKYLSMGINSTRAPLLRGGLEERSPIWWEGPDGSRILAYFHDHYAGAGRIGLTNAWPGQYDPAVGLEEAEARIPGLLNRYDRPDYPFNSIHVHGAYGDNRPLGEELPKTTRAWNDKYAYPKIVFANNYNWFSMIEDQYADELEVVRGDGGAFWEDGAGSSARETTINRQSQQETLLAEGLLAGLHARGKVTEDYRQSFMDIWHDIILYDEHTWGAHNSISKPDLPEVREQYRYKAEFANRASLNVKPLLEEARKRLGLKASSRKAKMTLDGDTLTTPFYTVTFDRTKGGISSIVEKDTGRELLDKNAPYLCGQVVYTKGGQEPPYEIQTSTFRGLYLTDKGAQLWLEHPMMPQIVLTLTANAKEKRLDFNVSIEKVLTYRKEGVYVAFPFAGEQPTVDYAVANAVVRAGRDWLPGACKDWFTLQNWLRVRSGNADTVWVTYDAPLINMQGINSNKWLRELAIENGHVYAYVMNNYWFTNYKAGQGGRHDFRFAITSGAEVDNAAALRFGQDWTRAERRAFDKMVSVSPATVAVSGFKRAESGEGYIVRLREMSGEPTEARLVMPAVKKIRAAHLTDGVEDNLGKLTVEKGTVPVNLKAWDVVTVRVE